MPTKNFLPISLKSHAEPHRIPCVLPDVTFTAYLPDAGLRVITTAWTTHDPVTARVNANDFEVRREDPDGNLCPDEIQSVADRSAAVGAAGRILDSVLRRLGLNATTRRPGPYAALSPVMAAISDSWNAEFDAVGRACDLRMALRADGATATEVDVECVTPDWVDPTDDDQRRSPACVALRGYVQTITDRACEQVTLEAERQAKEAAMPSDSAADWADVSGEVVR